MIFSVCLVLVNFFLPHFIVVVFRCSSVAAFHPSRPAHVERFYCRQHRYYFLLVASSVTLTVCNKDPVEFFSICFFQFEASWFFSLRKNDSLLATGLKDKATCLYRHTAALTFLWTAAVTETEDMLSAFLCCSFSIVK